MIGTCVGQYKCIRLLGEGGMGAVYLAIHQVLGTPRAVKILLPEWTRYPEIIERFMNEARAAAAIRHHNIIGVHDCGQLPSGEWFILMDYLEGGTLSSFIQSHGGPVSMHDTLHVLAEVANGVQAAHDHQIIHRDLKPDNIYLSQWQGDPHHVSLYDFGIAKFGERMGQALTGIGTVIGTPAYMAPEQLRGATVGIGADVFALGVIAYQMVTGGWLPYQTELPASDYYRLSPVELYQRISAGPPVDPRTRCPSLPEAWVTAIASALDPDPAKRAPSARAFALALAEATPGDGFAPSGLSLIRTYARELLELSSDDATVRAPIDDSVHAVTNTPSVVSRYRVLRRLGIGGMAEVFAGTVVGAEGFARTVAIKRVISGLSEQPQFATMFIDEARMASKLSHPNVVSVLDFDRDAEGRLFLVMELVHGVDLAGLLATGILPHSAVIFVISEVLRGLGYSHELPVEPTQPAQEGELRGLVHRDVSPHNVLLSWEGAVKVSDFGIAKALEKSSGALSATVKGKPAYMSPEQVNAEALDGRSDLFAVGVILWEMLTGQRLFHGNAQEMMAHVIYKAIQRPSQVVRGVPRDLEAVTMKLLERDRERRYANADQCIEALYSCADAPRNGRSELVQLVGERFGRSGPRRSSSSPGAPRPSDAPLSPVPAAAQGARDQARVPVESPPVLVVADPSDEGSRAVVGWRFPLVVGVTIALAAALLAVITTHPSRTEAPADAGPLRVVVRPSDVAQPSPEATLDTRQPETIPEAAISVAQPDAPAALTAPVVVAAAVAPTPAVVVPAAPKPGLLKIATRPWSEVWINGRLRGETPVTLKLAPGRYRLRLVNQSERKDKTVTVMITASKTTQVQEIL